MIMVDSFEQVAKAASAAREKFVGGFPDIVAAGQDRKDFENVEEKVRNNLALFKESVDDNLEQTSWGIYLKIIAWAIVLATTFLGYYDNIVQIAALFGITFLGTSSELGKEVIDRVRGYLSLKRSYQIWRRGAEMSINNCSIKTTTHQYSDGITCLIQVNGRIGDAHGLLLESGEASEKTAVLMKELQNSWK